MVNLRAFGGGLMSSFAETLSALTSPEPRRIWLDIERVMRTRYNFDEFQQTYFVVAGFEDNCCARPRKPTSRASTAESLTSRRSNPGMRGPAMCLMKGACRPRRQAERRSAMIRQTSDGGTDIFETEIDGETIQWDNGLTYARHLQTAQLLVGAGAGVGQARRDAVHHHAPDDGVVDQAGAARGRLVLDAIKADRLAIAGKGLDRIATIQRHMIHSWEILATLTPHDFLTFRGFLRRASGFQSQQYRELEYLLGNKREDMMIVHKDDTQATERLRAAFEAPSLYDELLRLLARRGFDIPADHLERDWTKPYAASDAVEDAWLKIYTDVDAHWDLYTLAEKITALEYYFQEWRFKHMKTVARVIGHKPGTGGSSGVNYLVKALDLSFFPELWSMRTRMAAPREGGDYAEGKGA
jgi:tryptophan 2,3-dioxygenase